ncbi:MAG: hypothetical protein P8L16_06050 [Ilumatobacter sp.]|nr:hypothetical protein [Ilumatobacter sp.]
MACVVRSDDTLTEQEVIEHLADKVAKWQLPKGVQWIDEVPKTSVGKFSKKTLRDEFGGAFMADQ